MGGAFHWGGDFLGGGARPGVQASPPACGSEACSRPATSSLAAGGTGGPVHGPSGRGEGGRGSERQRVRPGGRGGAGPVHIHLEEEDGRTEDHRDGGTFEVSRGLFIPRRKNAVMNLLVTRLLMMCSKHSF